VELVVGFCWGRCEEFRLWLGMVVWRHQDFAWATSTYPRQWSTAFANWRTCWSLGRTVTSETVVCSRMSEKKMCAKDISLRVLRMRGILTDCRITLFKFSYLLVYVLTYLTYYWLIVPRCRLNTYGRPRAFPVAGPTVWNSLPDVLRDPACNVDSLKPFFKTVFLQCD